MRIGRTLPPAAAPLDWRDLRNGVAGWLSPGRSVERLEADIRDEFRVNHVYLLSSGTAALTASLLALKSLAPRPNVIIPAYTCFSVPAAVLAAGLRPVPCDIDPATFDFDERRLEQTVDGSTLAVVAHHLFGVPAAIGFLRAFCRQRGVFLVEDAAQAMGIQREGQTLGTIGDVGIFSLGRGKNITCGSGGILVTNSPEIAGAIAERYREVPASSFIADAIAFVRLLLMWIFIDPRLYWIPASLPFLRLGQTIFPRSIAIARLSGMRAGVLRSWRRHLTQSNTHRRRIVCRYRKSLGSGPESCTPCVRFPLLIDSDEQRRRLLEASEARGLGLSAAYPTPISEIPELQSIGGSRWFPAAERVARRIVTLPTHHWLSDDDTRAIVSLCRDALAA